MSDSTESSRQATHAKQEGVDDNVAALAGPSADADHGAEKQADLATTLSTMDDAAPAASRWSSSVSAAPALPPAKKPGGEVSAKWVAAGMGIGSAALVAALLYARRDKR